MTEKGWWDGHERRSGFRGMEISIAEIHRDVKYIKENLATYKKEMDDHIVDDGKIHGDVTRHGAQITMLLVLFSGLTCGLIWIVIK